MIAKSHASIHHETVMIIAHHTVIAWRWDLKNKYNNNKYDNE
jgi:hypothetical protein